jgi:dephospho-CoA kinase
MLRVGLTGGIGCGKTTVAGMMAALGCHVVNADKMAHALIAPGEPAYNEIRSRFGDGILARDGSIDRAALASVVFADAEKLAALNAIVHPRVLRDIDHEFDRLSEGDPQGIGVVEAALLIEAGYHKHLDRIVLATCTHDQQLERLTSPQFGRAMTREQAEARIHAQLPMDEKRKVTHCEIDCSGTIEHTREQVRDLVGRLKKIAASRA